MDIFFYADLLPQWMQSAGHLFGIRMICMCSVANFFNLLLHFLIGGMLIWMMLKRKELMADNFFILLLLGISFSTASKGIDWYTNMLTATGTEIFFSYNLDLFIEGLQFVGMGIILYGILTKLFYIHHASTTTSN